MPSPKLTVSQIRQHSRQLVRELDIVKGAYMGSGYTFSQCHVLFELSSHNSLNLMELADILLIDKSNTSRTVKKLVELELVSAKKVTSDNRQKMFSLTSKGEKALLAITELADQQVQKAIENLNEDQQQMVIQGMQLYAGALRKSRLQSKYQIRRIQKKDNAQVARVICNVMTEFQAVGEGYSIDDREVSDMYSNYRDERSCYYVITLDDAVVGCGGIAPLAGGGKVTCELRKMFFLPQTRGLGLGRRLLIMLLNDARKHGYKKCYLETLDRMWQANELYKKNGFKLLDGPQGKTGHCSCDRWYLLNL
ncbi:MAG: GNAT family N-acetyltransferase [Mariniblastus sp.]|nr:GNAT family N-acetyltransferase [Mariniblastus sp.]